MARDKRPTTTDLTTGEVTETDLSGMATPGSYLPEEFLNAMGEDGFSSIDTVLLGAPDESNGKIPIYLGVLQERGEDIQMGEEGKSPMTPTWAFNPITRDGVVTNVTHIIPAAYQVHAACARIDRIAREKNMDGVMGFVFMGQGTTRKARKVNRFRIFTKLFPKGQVAVRSLKSLPPIDSNG